MPYFHQDFEREKLYEEIWSEPVKRVSKRYEISDVGLRKICISLDIPVPPRGFWEKLAAGKAMEKPSLQPTEGATTYRRSVFKNPQDDELSLRTRARIDEDAARAPDIPTVSMPTSIVECLPLVKRMAKKLEGKHRDSRAWPCCDGAGLMRAAVSPQNSLRALLALNMLLETLIGAGYSLSSGGKEDDPAYVTLLDSKLTFRVRERGRQEYIPLTREQLAENKRAGYNLNNQTYICHPTNELEISAFDVGSNYATATTADSRTAPVETKICGFVGKLRHVIIRNSVQAQMRVEQRALAFVQEAERARLAAIRRSAIEQLKRVEEWASKLERANRLRALATEFEVKKLKSSDDAVDATWLQRAADWLDPTVECRWDDMDNAPVGYGEF
ncbi:hypothetical protein B0G76_7481 [Paraburkholderia sp. BL23I1N1]|uniref:hypothetical protein n=1 Tax=Paraburkholderia sp. BL23I1N1 TaxID=1938802 RepID=UPI000E712D7A|nr:hypothetical protein [Paraburkholderia sp. BL23I1N1]RKE25908.1 hypothetical protein B0G76_7481 [Paraburkholderia sp. BL23I1N1]